MTPIVGDLIQSGVGAVVDVVKSYFPPDMTPEEKARLERDLTQALAAHQITQERERTQRHGADMASDSWLSKNIRPLVLVYLMIAWTVFSALSIAGGMVDAIYVGMLKEMLMAAFGFYFAGRSVEKITAILKERKVRS